LDRAIGVIDSGVGGLTVAHELMRQLPNEKIIYIGDTQRCPYGPRPAHEVKRFTMELVRFLMKKNIKMIVVACNTATAFALDDLKKELPIPVIGVIQPGARAAIKSTKNNKIGIIGTEGTIASQAYPEALKKINDHLEVTGLACPLFVPMVEKGKLEGDQAKKVVEETLMPLKKATEIDTLILGCTHYPLLEDTIQAAMGDKIQIISSSEETARETSAILEVNHLNTTNRQPNHHFFMTGDLKQFKAIYESIFKKSLGKLKSAKLEKIAL